MQTSTPAILRESFVFFMKYIFEWTEYVLRVSSVVSSFCPNVPLNKQRWKPPLTVSGVSMTPVWGHFLFKIKAQARFTNSCAQCEKRFHFHFGAAKKRKRVKTTSGRDKKEHLTKSWILSTRPREEMRRRSVLNCSVFSDGVYVKTSCLAWTVRTGRESRYGRTVCQNGELPTSVERKVNRG